MDIITIAPDKRLKHVIRQFWYANVSNPSNEIIKCKILADGAPGIIFQHCHGHSSTTEANTSYLPLSFAYGQSTSPCINYIVNRPFIFGVNFQPHAFKTLFSIDTSELTNTILDIADIFPSTFNDQLLHAPSPEAIIQLFSTRFFQKLTQQTPSNLIAESLHLIWQKVSEVNSKTLSSHVNISPRQFQRKFKAYVGTCPETYIRIVKFQQAIHLLRHRQYVKLSDIGYALNYADQSHFNREFKLFSGNTPSYNFV